MKDGIYGRGERKKLRKQAEEQERIAAYQRKQFCAAMDAIKSCEGQMVIQRDTGCKPFAYTELYDYCIRALVNELEAETRVGWLWTTNPPDSDTFLIPFAHPYKTKDALLTGKSVCSPTWLVDRMAGSIYDVLKAGFQQTQSTYTGIFYEELGMVVITNGIHHLAAAAHRGMGSAQLDYVRLADYFDTLSTDGAFFTSTAHPTVQPMRVKDYRIAVIYEFAKRKARIAQHIPQPEPEKQPENTDSYDPIALIEELNAAKNAVRYHKRLIRERDIEIEQLRKKISEKV